MLHSILNPVLAPLLFGINRVGTIVGDVLYAGLGVLPVWLGLTLISAVCGMLMLILFRYTSNQDAIGRHRDRMSANLLALKLFKDDIGVAFRCQGRLAIEMAKWQWHMLRPIFILIVLLLPVFAQMGTRYQWRPLKPGEETLLRVNLHENHADSINASIAASDGIAEAVGPVAGDRDVVWRLTAGEPGRYTLDITVGDQSVQKEFVVGEPFERVSALRPGWDWTSQILHPIESPLPGEGVVQSIEIEYPGVESNIYGANWWILYFFIISMLAAIAMLPFYKVRF